jgi:hypothetical protein
MRLVRILYFIIALLVCNGFVAGSSLDVSSAKWTITKDSYVRLSSIFEELNAIKLIKMYNLNRINKAENKPCSFFITNSKNESFIFKYLGQNKNDAYYFARFNDYLYKNNIKIPKVFKTKKGKLIYKIKSNFYYLTEFFKDFKTQDYILKDFFRLGKLAASINNIALNFYITKPRIYTDRLIYLKKNEAEEYKNLKKHFLKSHIHNDLHRDNTSIDSKIIDIDLSQYDDRIVEFNQIILARYREFTQFEILLCYLAYQIYATVKLNYHETIGIYYVLLSRLCENKRYSDILKLKNLKYLLSFV